jgi:hypothetical protein
MSEDYLSSPNPYRPYVVPIDSSPHIITPSKSPRDFLADLDIPRDYLENPELSDLVSDLVTKGVSKYASVFIRQPFEIIKTVMQVQYVPNPGTRTAVLPVRKPRRLDSDDEFDDVRLLQGLMVG